MLMIEPNGRPGLPDVRRFCVRNSFRALLASSCLAMLAALACLSSGAARAADSAASDQASDQGELPEVYVTGSRIKRAADAETVENVQVISAQEIQSSGQETVADYLRTISATFGNSANESFYNSFAPGASMVGLRGLSGKDTLILLNGRRITDYGLFQNLSDSFVDLNVIPAAAIDHIEILKSGGGAVYGSDAVAGVINIILKQNTTEKTVEFGGRATTEGGAATRDANVTFGLGDFASQGYNVFVTASAFKRDQLLLSQRDNTKSQDYSNLQDGSNLWFLENQYTGVPGPFPTCGTNGLPGTFLANGTNGPGCYNNDASEVSLMPSTDRANLTATGNLRLNDIWTAYGDLFYSYEETESSNTPDSLGEGSFVLNPATGGASSISNILPAGNPASLAGAATPINFGFQSVGDRDQTTVSNTYRVTAGIKGTWQGWDIDGGYGHSENHVFYSEQNGINAPNLLADIANGSYNFLNPLATPAASSGLSIPATQSAVAKLDTLDLKGSAGLFQLPGGPMGIALSAEFRHQSDSDLPGAAVADGLVANTGATSVTGQRNVYAVAGEFDFPIVKSLDADLALREEHYSDVGSNLRPQYTLRWQPLHDLTVRAVYAYGFRAPSLAEDGSSKSLALQTVTDPLDPQMRPFESIGFITGGNPLVKPESSRNLDIGIVFSPTSYLDVSTDFYNIYIYDVIAPNATGQQIVSDPAAYPGELVRNPNGTVLYAEALYTNQFAIHTSGLDENINVSIPLGGPGGKLKFGVAATTVFSFEVESGGAWSQFVGSDGWDYLSPISGGGPVPKIKGQVFAGWENPDWATRATWRYTDGYTNSLTTVGLTTQPYVENFDAVDLEAQYRGMKHWLISMAVVNLFNRQPPYDSGALLYFPTHLPYDPFTYDDLGRMVDLHVTYKF
jgi:iron complex outermembrane receptor protein